MIPRSSHSCWDDRVVCPLDGPACCQLDLVTWLYLIAGGKCFYSAFVNANLGNAEIVHDHAELGAEIDHLAMGSIHRKTTSSFRDARNQLSAQQIPSGFQNQEFRRTC